MTDNVRYFVRGMVETAFVLFCIVWVVHKVLTALLAVSPRRGRRRY